jgi:hypothetical protein
MSLSHQKKMRTLGGLYVGICMKRRTDHLDLCISNRGIDHDHGPCESQLRSVESP